MDNVEKRVSDFYRQYLKREPDSAGLQHILELIKTNQIKIEDLPDMFKTSEEYNSLQLWNHACVYTKNGTKMFINQNDHVISKQLAFRYSYEEEEINFLKTKISPGMTVIDIGANIGYHTLLFSKWVKPYGKIFAFEPDPTNFKLLKKNITANQIKNIVSFKNAVSDKNDKISLFLSEDNSGDHRINDLLIFKNDNMRKKIGTHSVKLDSVFSKSQKIDFIKIDIQGSEIQALNGMQNILKNRKNSYFNDDSGPYNKT